MSPVLLLGPTRWRAGRSPAVPEEIAKFLPPGWKRRGARGRLWPIDVRAALVGALRSAGVDATLMEAEPDRGTETRTGKFARLVSSRRDLRFFVFWPLRANLAGLVWELGHLAGRMEESRLAGRQVHVFAERGVVELDLDHDRVVFRETGHRTTYFEDLARWGCAIDLWADYEALFESVVAAGTAPP
jgi:hypothetical protein